MIEKQIFPKWHKNYRNIGKRERQKLQDTDKILINHNAIIKYLTLFCRKIQILT